MLYDNIFTKRLLTESFRDMTNNNFTAISIYIASEDFSFGATATFIASQIVMANRYVTLETGYIPSVAIYEWWTHHRSRTVSSRERLKRLVEGRCTNRRLASRGNSFPVDLSEKPLIPKTREGMGRERESERDRDGDREGMGAHNWFLSHRQPRSPPPVKRYTIHNPHGLARNEPDESAVNSASALN